ncbi:MAG: LacI family transcriptional regulator [Acidobacteriales bacterium]|nr:LacI family transcriptional regulator [Terriglobales bacterium]
MPANMKDVAKKAGVSVGTVSRVINQNPTIDPVLRQRVEKAIAELNYRPNTWARSLVNDVAPCISFVLSNRSFLHPVHSRILQGVEEYCDAAEYFVLYSRLRYRRETASAELDLPRVLRSHGIADCVILAGTNFDNLVEALEKQQVPFVLLANNFVTHGGRVPVDQVRWNDVAGARAATEYLIELGHREIWYIGDASLPWLRAPLEGYQKAMEAHGLDPREQIAALSDNGFLNGRASVDMIVERNLPMTAIFADAEVAYGAWEALRLHGLKVPGDVSMVVLGEQEGWSDVVPLTYVSVDLVETGRQLAKMAIEKMKSPGARFPEVVVPMDLIRRGTCRPQPITKTELVEAPVTSRAPEPLSGTK